MDQRGKAGRRGDFAIALLIAVAVFALLAATDTHREFQLKAESPQFWSVIDRDAKLDVVATGFGFTEGPVWDPSGFLYVSD